MLVLTDKKKKKIIFFPVLPAHHIRTLSEKIWRLHQIYLFNQYLWLLSPIICFNEDGNATEKLEAEHALFFNKPIIVVYYFFKYCLLLFATKEIS